MRKADYSLASAAEKENVIAILQRNAAEIEKQGGEKSTKELQKTVSRLAHRIRNGDVITGPDFERLVLLFRKQSPE